MTGLLRSTGALALATGLALAALPGIASAQDDRGERDRPGRGGVMTQAQQSAQSMPQSAPQAVERPQRQQDQPRPERVRDGNEGRGQAQAAQAGQVSRAGQGERAGVAPQQRGPGRDGGGYGDRRQGWADRDRAQDQAGRPEPERSGWRGGERGDDRGNGSIDYRRDRADDDQRDRRGYGGDARDNRGNGDGRYERAGRPDANRYDRDGRQFGNNGNHANWNRDWRRNGHYNWQGYRSAHRDSYRLGRYNSPYRSWNYRRLSVGFFLQPLFFSNSYWIGDPYAYRLPPAYGPYRWVRYYDDALLVNIYTGEVVDTIYDIFW